MLAEFPLPPTPSLAATELTAALQGFLSPRLFAAIPQPLADGSFAMLVGVLAVALQDPSGVGDLPMRALTTTDGTGAVRIAFYEPLLASQALGLALDLALALHRHRAGLPVDAPALTGRIEALVAAGAQWQPDNLTRALLQAARRRGVPVYAAAPGQRLWLYGQGAASTAGFEVATHRDSFTGRRLAYDKLSSNQFVRRLGLPGTEHWLAPDLDAAGAAAAVLGYPVVVKPADGSKGAGITLGAADSASLAAAFATAATVSPGRVLVERFVPGDDHRLVVLGGRLAWAVRRTSARVTGDGRSSIAHLVAAENARRRGAGSDIDAVPLPLDAAALAVLAEQGLDAAAVPAAGHIVLLSRVANKSRGGTISDCTDALHPDNKSMAETIARAFRLDAAGIDFITTDIGRSWRAGDCGVIEVNSTPGFSSAARAELIIRTRFPDGTTGRIPSVVLVGAEATDLDTVAEVLAGRGHRVGATSAHATRLGGEPRCPATALLPERVVAMVLDPGCTALVISATADDLRQHGFPLDRCDLAVVSESAGLSPALLGLVRDCAATLVTGLPA